MTTKEGKECKGGKHLNKKNLKRKESFKQFASHGIRAEKAVPRCQGHQVTTMHTQCLFGGVICIISAVSDKKSKSGRSGYQGYPSHHTTPLPKSELPKLREDISFPTIFLVKMKTAYLTHILRSASCLINMCFCS